MVFVSIREQESTMPRRAQSSAALRGLAAAVSILRQRKMI
jgi:hypothetical protein